MNPLPRTHLFTYPDSSIRRRREQAIKDGTWPSQQESERAKEQEAYQKHADDILKTYD